ncbi:MAG: hypothetical protein R3A50_04825 [Saprospiraceae bacterium]
MRKNTLHILIVLLATCSILDAQQPTIKLTQLETSKTVESTKAGQIGLTDTNGKQRYNQYVEIEPSPIAFTPTATGNTSNFSEFVVDPDGDTWYIDWQGRGILLNPAGTVDKNGYYGGNGGNGGDATIPSTTVSTVTDQMTWEFGGSDPGGAVPIRIASTVAKDFEDYMSIVSGNDDSLHIWRSDTDFIIQATEDLYITPEKRLILNGDSCKVDNVPDALATESTFLLWSPQDYLVKKEGISWNDLTQPVKDSINTFLVITDGPIQGDGSAGDPVTFADGVTSGDVWQWNGTAWVLASVSGTPQTISVASNTTTLSDGGGSMTIAGAGINSVSTAGTTITVTGTEVDGSIINEGSLTVGAGTGTTSLINSNTSGSTPVTLEAGTLISLSEVGNTITIDAEVSTDGPIQGDGSSGDPVTFVDGVTSGDIWQWNGTAWVLATVSGAPQTISVASNTTTLSDGGGSMTIAGAGINSVSTAGTTITVTGTEVDGSVSNEGVLSVGAGTSSSSIIQSNTSGSPSIILQTLSGSGLGINESGNTISLEAQIVTGGPLQGAGNSGDPLTFDDGVSSGDIWQWNGTAWVLASNSPQTLSVASNTTTLSDGGGSMTIAGAGINSVSTAGTTITVTGTEVDGSVSNEGSLTVGAGTGTTSLINSNTSGSTPVTLEAGTLISLSEVGNTITIDADVSTDGPIQGDGSAGDPVTFVDGVTSGDIWQWNGTAWVLASITETPQTISVASNTTTLSDGGGSMTIAGAGINSVSTAGTTITVTGTEVDGSISNEGSLTVGAGTGTTALINSNTSGSTPVTIEAGSGISIAEIGNTIILATSGADKNGYYGGNGGNGGDATIPSTTVSTVTDQMTWEFGGSDPGGAVPIRIASTVAKDFEDYMSIVSGNDDSLHIWRSDTDFIIQATEDLYITPEKRLILNGDSCKIDNVPDALATETTFLMWSPQDYIVKKEGISSADIAANIITPSSITSDQDDYSPTGWSSATVVRLSGDSDIPAITSMAAVSDGKQKLLINVGDYAIYFPAEHPDGTAANRISGKGSYFLFPGASANIYYDGTLSRWIFLDPEPSYYDQGNVVRYDYSAASTTPGDNEMYGQAAFSSGSVSVNGPASGGLPGYTGVSTSASTGGGGYAYLTKGVEAPTQAGSSAISFTANVALNEVSDATNSYSTEISICQGAVGFDTDNSIGFRYTHSANSGKWLAYSIDNAGSETSFDTGITVAALTFYKMNIELNKENTEARFFINGDYVGRITTGLPNAVEMGGKIFIDKTAGTSARELRLFRMVLCGVFP